MYISDLSTARNPKLLIRLLVLIIALLLTSLVQAQDNEVLPPCILGELHLRSQNGQPYIGGSGVVSSNPANNGIMPPGFLNNALSEKQPSNNSSLEDRMNGDQNTDLNVLLLVIDDFTLPLWTSVNGTIITHGDYVMETTIAAYHRFYDGYHVVVDSVNYASGGETTLAAVANAVQTKLSTIDTSRYDLIVFNMSWVILSCRVQIGEQQFNIADFYAQRLENGSGENENNRSDFIQYIVGDGDNREEVTAELEANILAYRDTMNSIIGDENSTPAELTELLAILQAQSEAGNNVTPQERITAFWSLLAHQKILPVAAAGNFGTDEPFAPAAWNVVVAVSGSIANSPGNLGHSDCVRTSPSPQACLLWHSSNFGQVTAPAAWHATVRDEYISGTSFATPLTSVLVAIARSHGCDVSELLNLPKDGNKYFVRAVFDVC